MTLIHSKITEEFNKDDMRALIESDLKKDLHMHTRFSDGELTPKELIDMRAEEGYELLAITDLMVSNSTRRTCSEKISTYSDMELTLIMKSLWILLFM